eukprot:6212190-Pleurochrysis_carterae.AAC.1
MHHHGIQESRHDVLQKRPETLTLEVGSIKHPPNRTKTLPKMNDFKTGVEGWKRSLTTDSWSSLYWQQLGARQVH